MGGGSDKKQVFADSGPKHMMTPTGIVQIDWDNEEHRRCISACLVKGVYVQENDRTWQREGKPSARAPAWWESFHFRHRPDYKLEFECRCSHCKWGRRIFGRPALRFIYGAVFEYAPPAGRRHPSAPTHVVAFRGTMTWDPTLSRDMRHNLRILTNKQGWLWPARKEVARLLLEDIANINAAAGAARARVWLAGHSQGASVALDVGRQMMTNYNVSVPAFLFNPPHVSLAPVIGEETRTDVYAMAYQARYFLGNVLTHHRDRMEEVFLKLSPWVPNLYVNERDSICKGFVHYFEQREVMKRQLEPGVATTAATLSLRDMLHSLVGNEKERPHLLPSAMVCKNLSQHGSAHGLRQWWQPQGLELVSTSKRYTWP